MRAATRTNFYQLGADGQVKPEIAVKLDSRKVDGMPLPRPLYEIFVYSPRLEAVHLRFGKVARGGIRWSDRPQDFRTEVLGLVKAQQVKNAVIVPVGAKGGFVPKRMPRRRRDAPRGDRRPRAWRPTRSSCRRCSTSPTISGRTAPSCRPPVWCATTATIPIWWSPPTRARRPSPTSPTASRSEHGFWLDDAFASGGSAGYDHKKMGITARGAWESVKRHFREMDIDIDKTPFSAVGVGDMSGDVFGNGMLRARTTKLVAALRSPRHLHRSLARSGKELRRAQAPVRPAALELAGLRQVADLARRRHLFARP